MQTPRSATPKRRCQERRLSWFRGVPALNAGTRFSLRERCGKRVKTLKTTDFVFVTMVVLVLCCSTNGIHFSFRNDSTSTEA